MKTIAVIGTASIQRYIFLSNKLKENVGASFLVKHALEEGLLDHMPGVDASEWFVSAGDLALSAKPRHQPATGEVLYLAGGNAVIIFNSSQEKTSSAEARDAMFDWSRWLLDEAPGLRVAVGMADFEEGGLSKAYKVARTQLERNENAPAFGSPLLALPAVRTCTSTGQPAVVGDQPNGAYLSWEAMSKQRATGTKDEPGPAQLRLSGDFKDILGGKKFPVELEDLGGEAGESHIAIVHSDGNDIGAALREVLDADYTTDEAFILALRTFAAQLQSAAYTAFHEVLTSLAKALPSLDLKVATGDVFPLRPIVYGGDDLTFVCDARLGLSLAECYLKAFGKKSVTINGKKFALSACAGVAIVPTKFPFSRACSLAAAICGTAKAKRRDKKSKGAWLDFQMLFSGADTSLDALRVQRFKAVTGENLLHRPWPIDDGQVLWADLAKAVAEFKKKWPRSVRKDLKGILAEGPDATKVWLSGARSRKRSLPPVGKVSSAHKTGWDGASTPYFDCLEASEFYSPLACGEKESKP